MPCVNDNKFVITKQEKIVLPKNILEAGLDIFKEKTTLLIRLLHLLHLFQLQCDHDSEFFANFVGEKS